MSGEQAVTAQKQVTSSERIDILEKALGLDSRLQAVEVAIKERVPESRPWWRDSKTVTIIGALIAAVLPLLKFIDESFTSSREYRRQVIEQQEKIRQTYLDRVVKPGVTVYEQKKIFGLLAGVSVDPEMQKWAQGELQETTASIDAFTKEREGAIKQKRDVCLDVARGNSPSEGLTKLSLLNQEIDDLDRRLGTVPFQRKTPCD
jgi:hypothetical protein